MGGDAGEPRETCALEAEAHVPSLALAFEIGVDVEREGAFDGDAGQEHLPSFLRSEPVDERCACSLE